MNRTATEQTLADRNEELARRSFHARAEQFMRRWAPKDPHENADFVADLMVIMRELQITQAQAYGNIVAREMSLRPFASFLSSEGGK